MKKLILLLIISVVSLKMRAQQIEIGSDLRSRYEYRHGYGTLIPDTVKPGNFIAQRVRMSFDFSNKFIKLRISPQGVKVWGDVSSTSKNDLFFGFHEAYGEGIINPYFSFKVGRQELNYDDARIFGNVDWAMQARSHDAVLFKINPDSANKIHIGLALNANKESNFQDNYLVPQYKTMQFLWYHGDFNKVGISFLALNNGMTYLKDQKEKIAFSQTFGPRFNFKGNSVKLDAAAYVQTGKIALNKVKAFYVSANAYYQVIKELNLGLGFEYISGKSNNDISTDVKSFNPLYGTNHKFNGFMDYFYVGNHINSTGLTDIYANIVFEKSKISAKFAPHYFLSSADLYKGNEKQKKSLGTELDFSLGYKIIENIKVDAGYSQLFATTSMGVLKGGDKSNKNNWFYLSIIFNPKLFTYKNENKI